MCINQVPITTGSSLGCGPYFVLPPPQSLSVLLIQIGPEFEFGLNHLLSFVKYDNFTEP